MTERRGRNGDEEQAGRVHGAWTTPAVVVRRPDGSVVADDEADRADDRNAGKHDGRNADRKADGDSDGERDRDGTPRSDGQPAGARPRVRPRRIPGAPGAVLFSPTLSAAGRDAGERLVRHTGELPSASPLPPRAPASVTPIRPRPQDPPPIVAGDEGGTAPGDPGSAGDEATSTPTTDGDEARRSRPPLAVVGAAIERSGIRRVAQGFDVSRFIPEDPEARAERLARLRRVAVGAVAAVVAGLIVYTVFPVRTALDLFDAEDRARERRDAFEREIEILEDEVDDLRTDERIELEARQQGMVQPGEESYGIMPAPSVPASDASASTPPPDATTSPSG